MNWKFLAVLAVLVPALLAFTSCGDDEPGDGPFENAGEEVDEAAEEAGEMFEEGVEETGEALEEAGEEIEESVD